MDICTHFKVKPLAVVMGLVASPTRERSEEINSSEPFDPVG